MDFQNESLCQIRSQLLTVIGYYMHTKALQFVHRLK